MAGHEHKNVTDALEATDCLESLLEGYARDEDWGALALVRYVLRRQSLLLAASCGALKALCTGQPTLMKLIANIESISPRPPVVVTPVDGGSAEEKRVPGPSPATPVPEDHAETIKDVQEGRVGKV
jgi:hypothetical protein